MPATTNPPVMEMAAEKTHTNNSSSGEGRILIISEGTMKMPLPITLPITMERQEMKFRL